MTCRFELGAELIVPGPVTEILTVAVLPPFFRMETEPTSELINPPTHVAVGGGIEVPPPPLTLHGFNSYCGALPERTDEGATSFEFMVVTVTLPGVDGVVSTVTSPDEAI